MAEPFTIEITERAEAHLRAMSAYACRIVLGGLETHLSHQPTQESRRIKALQPNPVASWELRLGDYRALSDVDEGERFVAVVVVGAEVGNQLFVQGQEYTDHESHRPERGEGKP